MASKPIEYKAVLIREPLKAKSEDWQETAHHWFVTINGQSFDYYTGRAHRTPYGHGYMRDEYARLKHKTLTDAGLETLLKNSKATAPSLDDVLHNLVSDADAAEQTFSEWCSNFEYDTDSRKALATYEACQQCADKLRKAGIDIAAERERLQDH